MTPTAHTHSNQYLNAYTTELRREMTDALAQEAAQRRKREKKR